MSDQKEILQDTPHQFTDDQVYLDKSVFIVKLFLNNENYISRVVEFEELPSTYKVLTHPNIIKILQNNPIQLIHIEKQIFKLKDGNNSKPVQESTTTSFS